MNNGLSSETREALAQGLSTVLADTYTLYLKTHNFHWNVTGPMFQTLHVLFETHYTEQWAAVDQLAERIRALGYPAPGSYKQFAELTSIQEADGVPNAKEMIRQLADGQDAVCRSARKVVRIAEEAGDVVSADLLTQRLTIHEKNAWMLRSLLEDHGAA